MSENTTGTDVQNENNNNEEVQFATVEDAVKAYTELKTQLDTTSKNLEQSRKEEKFAKSERKRLEEALAAASSDESLTELQKKYEAERERATALETRIRTKVVDGALTEALKAAKAKSVSTVMKLINRDEIKVENDTVDAKSVEAVIEKLRKEDPVLFDEGATPSVKRTTEGAVAGGFEQEIRAAKSQKEIETVMRRYGKL